ncbi:putative T7SS-secreted protein [Amycolatopsis sp. cg5]|uniref:putative T7SS-secreted protein n=1 Tax=Amycolatopsis sp. cg5 TaxID=3238802 RepID=UPI003524A42C
MDEIDDPSLLLPPIAGNAAAMDNECRRLTILADCLDDAGRSVRRAQVSSWNGKAALRFEGSQFALVKQYNIAADAHRDAAAALGAYQDTLENLQRLRAAEVATIRASPHPLRYEAARMSIVRWKAQLASAADHAARKLTAAAGEFAAVRPLLPERTRQAEPLKLTLVPPPRLPAVTRKSNFSPYQAHRDLEPYRAEVQKLSDAILLAWRGLAS